MALQTSGLISLSDVNVELGRAANAPISLDEAAVRNLAGKPTGVISLSDLYGKAFTFIANVAGGTNVNLRTAANAAGYDGRQFVELTLTTTATSNSTAIPALDLGTWPAGTHLKLVINAYVLGKGGAGGAGGYQRAGYSGGAGGPAIRANAISGGTITLVMGGGGRAYGGGGGGGGSGGSRTSHCEPQGGCTYSYGTGAAGGAGAGPGSQTGNGGGYGGGGGSGSANYYGAGSGGAGGAALVNTSLCTLVGWSGNYLGSLS
ncbi:hypothetical protein [Pseudomonas anguilliseptica]|uniref:hypothetical protein n=1 Tax=Pseudomonas anguilliseptica TaxID=53406 RepID=UPI00325AEAEF